jgi:c-di-GMP-binding flagellar brake protein YcgR
MDRCVQLSEGGMLVQAPSDLGVGERIEVNFFLENEDFVTSSAQVIYCRPGDHGGQYLIGLKFVNIPSKSQTAIRALAPN